MPVGTLEVLLVCAKVKGDPYALITCHSQEKRSRSIAADSSLDWNETLLYSISDGIHEIRIKIMDDSMGRNHYLGEATIPLDDVFVDVSIPPAPYDLIKDGEIRGEVRIGLNFCAQEGDCAAIEVSDDGGLTITGEGNVKVTVEVTGGEDDDY